MQACVHDSKLVLGDRVSEDRVIFVFVLGKGGGEDGEGRSSLEEGSQEVDWGDGR